MPDMKLVVDVQSVQTIHLIIGGIELPLTREQAVQMLFGDEYEIVEKTGHPKGPKALPKKPKTTTTTVIKTAVVPRQLGTGQPKMKLGAMKEYYADKRAKGICLYCTKKAATGSSLCSAHHKVKSDGVKKVQAARK